MHNFRGIVRTVIMAFVLVLALGMFTACSSDDDGEALVGRWLSNVNDFQYDFHAGGTGVRGVYPAGMEEFRWRIERGYLIMNIGPYQWPVEEWSFTIRRNLLTFSNRLTPGYVFEFDRVEQ